MNGGALMHNLQNMVLAVTAVSVFSGIAMQLSGDDDNGTGIICGLCIAGCILEALGNVLDAFM